MQLAHASHEILRNPRRVELATEPRLGWDCQRDQQQLLTMLTAYRPYGGAVSGDELTVLVREHQPQPLSMVARWIVRRAILNFNWRGHTMVPLFQFDRTTMTPQADLLGIIGELIEVFDDWDVSLWFATPNRWIDDASPVSVVRANPKAVLHAACADRCIALG